MDFASRKDWPAAVHAFREAIKIDPGYVDACYDLARILSDAGRWAESVEAYDAVIERYEEAVGFFRRGLAADPRSYQALAGLGGCLSLLGHHEEAIEACTRAVGLAPEAAETHFNLGVAYSNARHHDAAARAFSEAVRLKPGWTQAHLGRAEELKELGRFEESLASFRSALAIDPTSMDGDPGLRQMYEDVAGRV
jgi:tetratricopeptide (TPR) repeat protein